MTYTPWEPSHQTSEARAAVEAWAARKMAAGETLDPHDPEMLMLLDKGDIVSRYQLLLSQMRHKERDMRAHHDYELRRVRETAEDALRWWSHCLGLRRQKRKTANLADMEAS